MAKKMKKTLALILAMVMAIGMFGTTGFAANTYTVNEIGSIILDKTAEWTDAEQGVADVTLSVGGDNEALGVDIVYILGGGLSSDGDIISCLAETFREIVGQGIPVNFGLVSFSTDKDPVLELTTVTNDEEITALEEVIAEALAATTINYDSVNMENALVKAYAMLAASPLASHPERQHLIVIGSGHTYFFNAGENNDTFATVPVNLTDNNGRPLNKLFYTFRAWMQARSGITGSYPVPKAYYGEGMKGWDDYWADIQEWAAADIAAGDPYTYVLQDDFWTFLDNNSTKDSTYSAYYAYISEATAEQIENSVVASPQGCRSSKVGDPIPEAAQHAILYERAMYEAYNYYRGLQAKGINCYAIYNEMKPAYTNGYVSSENPWTTEYIGHCFMNELAGGTAVQYKKTEDKAFFDPIKASILSAIPSGSFVEDAIGEDFDFIDEASSITLTVGDTVYTTTKLDTAAAGATSSYAFANGEADPSFTLDYYAGENEKFVWTFGEDVSKYAAVSLDYQVLLTSRSTEAGTYVVATNEYADLYPAGSNDGLAFPEPELEYTVDPTPKYTVTYTDGVEDEEVFADQINRDLEAGAATPAFNGVPSRDGYNFTGWSPEVADTVTGDITYTAQWTPVPVLVYTVTYTDGVAGETVFADQINSGLSYGASTPAFNGTPTRDGYEFAGWSPAVSDTVTRSVTYTAQWTPVTDIPENDIPMVPVPEVFSDDHYAYVVGYDDGLIHPESNITRAEVATIFFRLLTDEVREANMTAKNSFSDVKSGMWFNNAVSTMAAMGIVNGYEDGTFRPNAYITRAEFAAIAARFDPTGSTEDAGFTDIGGHWAEELICVAANNGWVKGYEDGSFRPNQLITRAEAMTLVNNVLHRIPGGLDDLLDDMITWPDNMDTAKWYYLTVQEATNSHHYQRHESGHEYWTEMREARDWTELEY